MPFQQTSLLQPLNSPTLWALVIGATVWGGCGQCPVDIVHVDKAGSTEETVVQLAISGMMCEIACVSKVRKELYDVQGVSRADIDFAADRKVDTAYISFDPELVQAEELISTVQQIGDGLYSVEAAEVIHYAPETRR